MCFCVLYCKYCIEYSSTVFLFQAQDVQSKCKSSSDVAGTSKKCQAITMETKVKIIERVKQGKKIELEAQRKDEERQEEEEVTEEPKRFTTQEMARGFSLRRHC